MKMLIAFLLSYITLISATEHGFFLPGINHGVGYHGYPIVCPYPLASASHINYGLYEPPKTHGIGLPLLSSLFKNLAGDKGYDYGGVPFVPLGLIPYGQKGIYH